MSSHAIHNGVVLTLLPFAISSSALEELSVRSNIVLSQKKFVGELELDSEELETEYIVLCAQVVSMKARDQYHEQFSYKSGFEIDSSSI